MFNLDEESVKCALGKKKKKLRDKKADNVFFRGIYMSLFLGIAKFKQLD